MVPAVGVPEAELRRPGQPVETAAGRQDLDPRFGREPGSAVCIDLDHEGLTGRCLIFGYEVVVDEFSVGKGDPSPPPAVDSERVHGLHAAVAVMVRAAGDARGPVAALELRHPWTRGHERSPVVPWISLGRSVMHALRPRDHHGSRQAVRHPGYRTVEFHRELPMAVCLTLEADPAVAKHPSVGLGCPTGIVRVEFLKEVEPRHAILVDGEVEAGTIAGSLGSPATGGTGKPGQEGKAPRPDQHKAITMLVDEIDVPPGKGARRLEEGRIDRDGGCAESEHGPLRVCADLFSLTTFAAVLYRVYILCKRLHTLPSAVVLFT